MKRVLFILGLAALVTTAAPASAAVGDVVWSHTKHSDAVKAVDSNGTTVFSGGESSVQAVAASDGSTVWSSSIAANDLDESNGTVAVAEYFTNDVVALDADAGTQQWSHSHHTDGSLSVAANTTYVASGAADNRVVLADAGDGAEVWNHSYHGVRVRGVAIADGVVISYDGNGNVVAADAGDGSKEWNNGFGTVGSITISDGGHTAYLSDGQDLVALNTSDGSVRWRQAVADSSITDVATNGTTVVASVDNGNLVAYTTQKRETIFKASDGSNARAATVDGSQWYAAYGDNSVVAFDADLRSTLFIRDEQNPEQLVTDETNITLESLDGDGVYTTTVSDGTADLAGLEAEPLIVRAGPDGWGKRSLVVSDTSSTRTVYVLNTSAATSNIRFELEDQTGRFDADETILRIQRPIQRDGDTTFETVLSDRFGATKSLSVTLETGQNYRLVVENDAGEIRTLGSYDVSGDAAEPLPIGEIVIAGDARDGGVAAQASLQNPPPDASHGKEVRMILIDRERLTENFTVRIVNESGAVIRPGTNETGPFGRWAETYPVTSATWDGNETLYVQYNISRNGEVIEIERPVGDLPDLAEDWAIDGRVLELMGLVGIVALMGFVVIAAPSLAAIVGVLFTTILTLLGIVDIPGVALGVAGSVAILYRLGEPGQ